MIKAYWARSCHDWEKREKVLINALREIYDLADSGSAEMAIVNEALGKVNRIPWKTLGGL